MEGHRDEDRQNKLFEEGKTKVKWPDSKHNTSPSKASDSAPYPLDWRCEGELKSSIKKYAEYKVKIALLNVRMETDYSPSLTIKLSEYEKIADKL